MESIIPSRKLDDYVLGPMLGKGFFGHVRIATRVDNTNVKYAIKYMKIGKPHSKENLLQMLQQEATLQIIRHPNILQVYSINSEGYYEKYYPEVKRIPVVYAVMQLAQGGDLFDFLTSTGALSEDMARFFFIKILNTIEYLHYSGIAHRDIKLENILLDQDFNPLLTDFGLSRKLSEIGFVTNNPSHRVGTERTMSPELLGNGFHSAIKDDLFALGYLLFMMVARHPPFLSTGINNEHYRLLRENRVLEYWKDVDSVHSSKWCSDNFKHLITIMLAFNMTVRLSTAEIRAHPWMQGSIPSEAEVKYEFQQRQVTALECQIKQAQARKKRKDEIQKNENAQKKRFGPHKSNRSMTLQGSGEGISQTRGKRIRIKDFGEPTKRKPTIFISGESVEDIAIALISFFSSAKSIKINQSEHKV